MPKKRPKKSEIIIEFNCEIDTEEFAVIYKDLIDLLTEYEFTEKMVRIYGNKIVGE